MSANIVTRYLFNSVTVERKILLVRQIKRLHSGLSGAYLIFYFNPPWNFFYLCQIFHNIQKFSKMALQKRDYFLNYKEYLRLITGWLTKTRTQMHNINIYDRACPVPIYLRTKIIFMYNFFSFKVLMGPFCYHWSLPERLLPKGSRIYLDAKSERGDWKSYMVKPVMENVLRCGWPAAKAFGWFPTDLHQVCKKSSGQPLDSDTLFPEILRSYVLVNFPTL